MKTVCQACFRHCSLSEGQTGFCRARKNQNGKMVCENYGKITSMALDPIEKKPLRRFYPGSKILSLGSYGCNFTCPFCQNHEISMAKEAEIWYETLSPKRVVREASSCVKDGNIGLAYTYNEPLIGYEFVKDCAVAAKNVGLKNVVVTNGSLSCEILKELLPFLDAFNVDLKGFTDTFYEKAGGRFSDVQDFIRLASSFCHVEITTLIIPGENDSLEEMEQLSSWIAGIRPDIPLHISRFFPRYRMQQKKATQVEHIYRLAEVAEAKLTHVYCGNC